MGLCGLPLKRLCRPPQVFLDKTWFTPVGQLLSDRDEDLRKKLASVRDDSGELKGLQVSAARLDPRGPAAA